VSDFGIDGEAMSRRLSILMLLRAPDLMTNRFSTNHA
jgi:hypothetical protein